jgi:RHS repeat-associated protein
VFYIPGPAIDEPIAMVTATTGAKEYFHTNHQGSVIAMSDATGAKAEGPYTYDPYGNCFSGAGAACSAGEPYRFTGRRFDPETGLLYYRARYYAPDDGHGGRFLQTDPVGYTADLNLYAYVGNDPTNRTDPRGLCAPDVCKGGDSLGDIEGVNETYSDTPVGSLHQDIGSLGSNSTSPQSLRATGFSLSAGGANPSGSTSPSHLLAPTSCPDCVQMAAEDRGMFGYEPRNPESPFAATPEFVQRFRGSSEEAAVLKTLVGIASGTLKAREAFSARQLELPGDAKTFYYVYQTGTPRVPGAGRIANVPGSRTYYYSPGHYGPSPGVPHTWVEIEYPGVDWR